MPVEVGKNFKRKRLMSPSKCARGSFRVKNLAKGKKLVVCCPKSQWSPRTKRCKVGTRGQSLLTPKR